MNRSYKNEPSVMKMIEIYPEPLKKQLKKVFLK